MDQIQIYFYFNKTIQSVKTSVGVSVSAADPGRVAGMAPAEDCHDFPSPGVSCGRA